MGLKVVARICVCWRVILDAVATVGYEGMMSPNAEPDGAKPDTDTDTDTAPDTDREVWTLAHARAKLSAVIERAANIPQTITLNGQPKVVVVSVAEWERKTTRKTTRKGSLAEFLLHSPLRGSEFETERIHDAPSALDL